MIIKSMGRKKSTSRKGQSLYATLMNYMMAEPNAQVDLEHNIPYGLSRDEVIELYEDNARYMHERQGANLAYHEIISLPHSNNDKDQMKVQLRDIGKIYLDKRAKDNLGIGVIHEEKDHLHLHIMVSANKLYDRNRHRISKKDFLQIQQEVSQEVQVKYPNLNIENLYRPENIKAKNKDYVRLTRNEQEQVAHNPSKQTQKQRMAQTMQNILATSRSPVDLQKNLEAQGLSVYQRGNSLGIVDREGKRHRFSTLGIEPKFHDWKQVVHEQEKRLLKIAQVRSKAQGNIEQIKALEDQQQARVAEQAQARQKAILDKTTEAQARLERLANKQEAAQQNIDALALEAQSKVEAERLARINAVRSRAQTSLEALSNETAIQRSEPTTTADLSKTELDQATRLDLVRNRAQANLKELSKDVEGKPIRLTPEQRAAQLDAMRTKVVNQSPERNDQDHLGEMDRKSDQDTPSLASIRANIRSQAREVTKDRSEERTQELSEAREQGKSADKDIER